MKLSERIFKEHKFPLIKPTMFNQEQGYDVNSVELFLEERKNRVGSIWRNQPFIVILFIYRLPFVCRTVFFA